MADILIKGMEMPKNCLSCPMKEHCQLFNALHFNERLKMLDENRRVDGCPLVELPPHGRLGDLDKIADRLHGFYEKHLENGSYETAEIWKYAEQEVRLQGTIVEASATTPSRNHTCPYYQGVCGLDDDFLCYCHSSYEMCDTYKEVNNGLDN